jgi:hypothetical protein
VTSTACQELLSKISIILGISDFAELSRNARKDGRNASLLIFHQFFTPG